MTDKNPPLYANEDQLVQNALLHVQRVFVGNGLKKEDVLLISHKVTKHSTNAGTYLELKPIMSERKMPGRITVGTLASSRDEATKSVNQMMVQAATNSTTKAKIANILLERADQGFGLNKQTFPIEFLKNEITWHEPCHACKGSTKTQCQKCHGVKFETCMKCTGRGLMPCPMCRSTGLLHGNKCTRCHGQRFVACDMCHRSGKMSCRTCNGMGISKCVSCNAVGFQSQILTLTVEALSYFEYDAKSIPKNAADAIEIGGANLAAKKTIQIKGRIADDKENALGASYEVEFPCGEIIFEIGKKNVRAEIFGYDATITGFPNLLDKLVAPIVRDLEGAANDVGSVAKKIKNATGYKLLARAYLLLQKTNKKNALSRLLKVYDIGLSAAAAKNIIMLADTTAAKITKKPRLMGFAFGLFLTSIFSGLYYLIPWHDVVLKIVPNLYGQIILEFMIDILPVFIGGFTTKIIIQKSGAKSIQTALGHLVPPEQRKNLVANARELGVLSYIACAIICFFMVGVSIFMGATIPSWIMFIKTLLGL